MLRANGFFLTNFNHRKERFVSDCPFIFPFIPIFFKEDVHKSVQVLTYAEPLASNIGTHTHACIHTYIIVIHLRKRVFSSFQNRSLSNYSSPFFYNEYNDKTRHAGSLMSTMSELKAAK